MRKELNTRRDECLWNYILTFGSRVRFLPELPIGSVAQPVEQKGSLTTDLSSHLARNSRGECRMELQQHERDAPCGSTPHLAGALWHERDSRCFIIPCRRGDTNTWRMQAGLQVARPSRDGRSGVQITLPLYGAGWRSHRLADPCRQPIEQGECLREYIGIWRFESARRSVDRSVSRIDLSPTWRGT